MRAVFLLLAVAGTLSFGGCVLERAAGNLGDACSDTGDCGGDDSLACVSADPDDASAGDVCMPAPDGWICAGKYFKDIDHLCDCGCGIIDVDCAGDASAAACEQNNCESGDPLPTNNADCG